MIERFVHCSVFSLSFWQSGVRAIKRTRIRGIMLDPDNAIPNTTYRTMYCLQKNGCQQLIYFDWMYVGFPVPLIPSVSKISHFYSLVSDLGMDYVNCDTSLFQSVRMNSIKIFTFFWIHRLLKSVKNCHISIVLRFTLRFIFQFFIMSCLRMGHANLLQLTRNIYILYVDFNIIFVCYLYWWSRYRQTRKRQKLQK